MPPVCSTTSSSSTTGYADGLGVRTIAFDREAGGMLEQLRLRPELTLFERVIQQAADTWSGLTHRGFAHVHGVVRDPRGLVVTSDLAAGERLSELLAARSVSDVAASGVDAALGFLLEALPALSRLHNAGLVHGLLSPGHIVITASGEVVLTDGIYASAIERGGFGRAALASRFGLVLPPVPRTIAIDARLDLSQAALCAVGLALGRPIGELDEPNSLARLLVEVNEIAQIRGGHRFADEVRMLLGVLLSIERQGKPSADASAREAQRLARSIGEDAARSALADLVRFHTPADDAPAATTPDASSSADAEYIEVEITFDEDLVAAAAPSAPSTWATHATGSLATFERVPQAEAAAPLARFEPVLEIVEEPDAIPDEDPFEIELNIDVPPHSVVSARPAPAAPVKAAAPAVAPPSAPEPLRKSSAPAIALKDTVPAREIARVEMPAPAPAPALRATTPAPDASGLSLPEPSRMPAWQPTPPPTPAPVFAAPPPRQPAPPPSTTFAATPAWQPAPPAPTPPPAPEPSPTPTPGPAPAWHASAPVAAPTPPPASTSAWQPAPPPPAAAAWQTPAPAPAVQLRQPDPVPAPVVQTPVAPAAPQLPVWTPPATVPAPQPLGGFPPEPRATGPFAVHTPTGAPPVVASAPAPPHRELATTEVATEPIASTVTSLVASPRLSLSRVVSYPPRRGRAIEVVDTTPQTAARSAAFRWKIVAAAAVMAAVGLASWPYLPMRAAQATEANANTGEENWEIPADAKGTLLVDSQPAGAEVKVDGVDAGKTPLRLEGVSVGPHLVTVSTSTISVQRSVEITSGGTATVNVPVYSGWVAVFSPIKLEVAERGRVLGTTDTPRIMLAPGRHVLTLSNRQFHYSTTETVEILAGEERVLNLQPKGTVNINALPWAEVWVDGTRAGETPLANLQVPLGTREFVFRHPAYGARRMVTTITTKEAALSVDFTKPVGRP